MVGITVITTFVFAITGLIWLTRYIIAAPKRKERKRLLAENLRISPDGKKMCIYCKKFTDDQVDKNNFFCIECGRQRGIVD